LSRITRRLRFGLIASALMLVIGGLAFADEGDLDDLNDNGGAPEIFVEHNDNGDNGDNGDAEDADDGPPWLQFEEIEWRPGDGTPQWAPGNPPWSEGNGPPWLQVEEIEWRPGDGKPPWAGEGNGPPPWAGSDDDED
jgi:hypothetical protein